MQKTLLIIGSVWPEPNSSAAGSRMMQLIQVFIEETYKIIFASASIDSAYRYPLEELGIEIKSIVLNDDSFDKYIGALQPDVVLFDRFMTEEQFGWRVEKFSNTSLRILDTEDLHCLRKARQIAVKENREFHNGDLNLDIAKREIASIYRSDLSLMISKFEMKLLQEYFKVPAQILFYIPFLLEEVSLEKQEKLLRYHDRINFVTIGSFRHEPNWDSVLYLKKEIWPVLSNKIPDAELHIYGSYPPEKAMQLHKPKDRFHIKGWAKDANKVIESAKVLLSPIRFGAGLKGKFIDGMLNGTPSVTTSIGAEAMHENLDWGGVISDEKKDLIIAAEELYKDEDFWLKSQKNGFEIIKSCYSKQEFKLAFLDRLQCLYENISEHRDTNFIGSMLLFHTMRSTEFMSRWISEKNK